MEIWRDRKPGRLWVSQEKYIEKVLQAFFVDQSKLVSTPLVAHFKLDRSTIPGTDKEVKYMKTVPYSSAVRSLMYAMVCTRPNLAHAVSMVSRFMANPGKAHWKVVKWILRYLKCVSNICLVYDGKGHGDGLKSTLQPMVALSMTEAEYMSMTKGIKECIWLHGLVQSLGLKVEKPILFCDSQSALSLTKNLVYHERTKYIDVRLNFIRDVLEEDSLYGSCPMDMSSRKFDLEKFNGSNDFTLWKVKMRALLIQQGCAVALEGDDRFPKDTKEEVKKEILEKAHSAIFLSVTDEVLREVVDQTTASELWDKLCEKYHNNSLTNRLYQKHRLYTLRMSERVGVKLDDEDQALILLCSLPGSYENFVDTMLYGRTTISVNDMKDALLSKELKRKVYGDKGSSSGLFAGRGRSQERNNGNERSRSKSRNSSKVKCYRCKEKGHIKRDCPQKKGNSKGESSNSGSATIIQDSSDDGDFGDVLTVCSASTVDTWNSEFVPCLKKNLIYLGTLAKNGLKYHGKGEWVKVSRGALVLMKGKLQHGIYFLQGSSVIGTSAVSQSSDKCDDRKNLGHRRLGHMSEQGLSMLSKQGLLGGDVTDLWGPSLVKSQGGCVYFVTFIDDYSRKVNRLKTLRTDNGLEFCNAPFDNFCKKEAVNTASYLVNRSPSTAIGLKTPQEVWFGKPSDYSHVRIFGCPAYAHVNDKGKSPDKFLISRDVTFDESAMLEQSRGCESFTGTKDCGADQKVVFDTPDIFVIKEEQQEKNNTDQPKQPEQSEPQVDHPVSSLAFDE
ncbi:retrovirus-related pol polyprotein from transposon TNT 1-94 [Tanacetum coccineum]